MQNKASNIYLNKEARDGLIRGVDAVADPLALTLGAAGANAVLQSPLRPGHLVTNDGVSIARMAFLEDPVEMIGANLIKEIANGADHEGGDGTTTATVLAQAILHAGAERTESPMEIKRSLDECLPLIMKSLDEQTKQITPEEVFQVASISAEDEELGKMLQEIYTKIGRGGMVEIENSNLPETFYEETEGIRLRNVGIGMFIYSMTEPGKAVYKDITVLVTNQEIKSADDIIPIMQALQQQGKNELVIYCYDIDLTVANRLALTHNQGGFKTLILKAPTAYRDWITEDFARATGATVIDPKAGITWKTVRPSHLGHCDKIITTKEETRVYGVEDMEEFIKYLNEKGDDDSKLRASWLATKAAILKVGGRSDSELSYKKLKAEDARNAAYQALQEGIVPGGGVALSNACVSLPSTVGGRILREALQAPMEQIYANAGSPEDADLMETEKNGATGSIGFDAKSGKMVDMWVAGIVDPVKVTKSSITSALSVAGTVLTTKIVVTIPKQIENAAIPTMPGM